MQFTGSVLHERNMQFFPFFSFLLSRMRTGWLDHKQQPWTMEWKPHAEEVEQSEKIPVLGGSLPHSKCISHDVLDIFFFLNLSQI